MPINYFKKNWIETHNPETGEDLKENRAVVKATKENPVVVICDGHGSHHQVDP